jgi:hypothetical protein
MVDGFLVSMKYVVYKAIIGAAKHIMPKQDNLEKNKGKQQIEHDIPSKNLKKNQVHCENNNKHSQNLVLFNA